MTEIWWLTENESIYASFIVLFIPSSKKNPLLFLLYPWVDRSQAAWGEVGNLLDSSRASSLAQLYIKQRIGSYNDMKVIATPIPHPLTCFGIEWWPYMEEKKWEQWVIVQNIQVQQEKEQTSSLTISYVNSISEAKNGTFPVWDNLSTLCCYPLTTLDECQTKPRSFKCYYSAIFASGGPICLLTNRNIINKSQGICSQKA